MVYVQNKNGLPLMPCKEAKARKLLDSGKAKVIRREPFVIRLLFECDNQTQPITLGIATGSKHFGLSASTDKKEVYASVVELRNDITGLLADRRQYRRARRSRLRHRQARFNNRVATKKQGWLAPSVRHKVQTHLKAIENVTKILPITKIVVQTAAFDIQKIKNPDIEGKEYQQGEQLGFWNVREYVLYRDGHKCQCCKGKSGDKVLNVHHIESRKTGGDAPNNLVTLCETCHKNYHKGLIELPKNIRRGKSFKDEAFMNIMRWALYGELKKKYKNVSMTFGYLTKHKRIKRGLPKTPYTDARCIANHADVEPLEHFFYQKKVRCHNRKIHKAKILKGGVKRRNQAPYLVKGFRLFDKVEYRGNKGFVFGRRTKGYFDLRTLQGITLNNSASVKEITFLEPRKSFLTERRMQDANLFQKQLSFHH